MVEKVIHNFPKSRRDDIMVTIVNSTTSMKNNAIPTGFWNKSYFYFLPKFHPSGIFNFINLQNVPLSIFN